MKLGYTKIGWCKCGQPFIRKRGAKRIYCDICQINNKRDIERRSETKRPNRNGYIAKKMAEYRRLGTVQDKQSERRSADIVGKPQKKWTKDDWTHYHNKIKKMKQQTVGGYQEYEEVE